MRNMTSPTRLVLCMLFFALINTASADPIEFTYEGTFDVVISGGTLILPEQPFLIRAFGNTDDRDVVAGPTATQYTIPHLSASIELVGLGTFQIISETVTRSISYGLLSFLSPTASPVITANGGDLVGWDMLSSMGPLAGALSVSVPVPLETTAGEVAFFEVIPPTGDPTVTFTATVIPEPATSVLFAGAIIAALFCHRRFVKR